MWRDVESISPRPMPMAKQGRKRPRSGRNERSSGVTSEPLARRRRNASALAPTTSMATVPSMKGAPTMAPIATCSDSPPARTATTGISDSGSAVPTAASRLPMAPSPRSRRLPAHSIAFVNRIAPPMISANAAASRSPVMRKLLPAAARRSQRRGSGSSLTVPSWASADTSKGYREMEGDRGRMTAVATRWASFDCYGTLIDWNAGIRTELTRIFGEPDADRLLSRYHELEPRLQADEPTLPYREVMAGVLAELARDEGVELPAAEADALGRSLPSWPAFAEVPDELRAARERGWQLAILSNTDRDLIEASMERIGVPFEFAIVASEIGSYKPALGHWRAFEQRVGRLPDVHVAASLYHDVGPANQLDLRSVWVNRLGERPGPQPTREIPDLSTLPDVLDEL